MPQAFRSKQGEMIRKLMQMLHLSHPQSETPIGDQLAREMRIDLSAIQEHEMAVLHRMQYERNNTSGHWVLTCDECGLWVFDSEEELFAHVIIHSKEALNAYA